MRAIAAAEQDDLRVMERLLAVLSAPYERGRHPGEYRQPAPDGGPAVGPSLADRASFAAFIAALLFLAFLGGAVLVAPTAVGETWSRPALTYAPRNDSMALEPRAYLVFGSGYRNGSGQRNDSPRIRGETGTKDDRKC